MTEEEAEVDRGGFQVCNGYVCMRTTPDDRLRVTVALDMYVTLCKLSNLSRSPRDNGDEGL